MLRGTRAFDRLGGGVLQEGAAVTASWFSIMVQGEEATTSEGIIAFRRDIAGGSG